MSEDKDRRVGNGPEVVIVTGGARGIGAAYVRALVEAGYAVVVADLHGADELVSELSTESPALALRTDVADPASSDEMAAAALDRFGRIDVLINNAAYFTDIRKRAFEELTVAEWEKALGVNVIGSWLCARAVAPAMKRQRAGKIVNTASMVVPTGIPGFLHYVASKSAILGMTRALARELGEWNVAVNTISPDYIPHDDEYAARQPEMAEALARQRCLERDMVPEDLVGTILYLVGHGSDFLTGQNIHVNGGRWFG